jgi:hypothetical protein
MTSIDPSSIPPWYLVLEAWQPVPHYGLGGLARPLPPEHPAAIELKAALEPFPLSPGGCLFEVCFDLAAATRYYDAARAVERVYLIEVALLETPLEAVSGYDMGQPEGGFSVAGEDICSSLAAHRRFGHLVNADGLFPSREILERFLEEREIRLETEGVEHLDESLPVKVRVLIR